MRGSFKSKMRIAHWGLLFISCCAYTHMASADAQRGMEISQARKAADTGWGDTEAEMRMILRNAQGQESVRELRVKSLEVENDGDKALTIFDRPRDVSGTAFLSFSKALEPDLQWIYLPALKRVKRINSKNKSGPFMGSEFAFEDMTSFELEKYEFSYLNDDTIGGRDAHVVEQKPLDRNSGYTRQQVWIDKEHFYVVWWFWGPGRVPSASVGNSVQNAGVFASVAPTAGSGAQIPNTKKKKCVDALFVR